MPNDPQRGSATEGSLRASFCAMDRRREQHYAEWDRMLASGQRELDGRAAELEATLKAKIEDLRQQTAKAMAEVAELPDEEAPPAAPEPSGQRQLGPEDIARLPLGSPEHMALRREHGMSQPFVL